VAFSSPNSQAQKVFDQIVELFFLADIILSNSTLPLKAIDFFLEYKDPETYESVRNLSLIAKRYLFRGWFFFDIIAIFPFQLMFRQNGFTTKMIRMVRLPRLVKLIDISRFNQLLKSLFENNSQEERILMQYLMMYCYKIFRLFIIAFIITYFSGCLWFLISNEISPQPNFISEFDLHANEDFSNLIISCYFALTTLATVGYGDYYPVSDVEIVLAVVFMLCGVAFFSYIMGSFIDIISNYQRKMGVVDKSGDLRNWMTLLTRFTNNKPLTKSLSNSIEAHFSYYWQNDRLACIHQHQETLAELPKAMKRKLMTEYLFQDIFFAFRGFFKTNERKDSKFLYDVA